MASLRSRLRRFPVPDEPGEWMAFRRLSEEELLERADLGLEGFLDLSPVAQFDLSLRWLEACLREWSYEEPCEPASFRLLDRPTLVWAFLKAMSHTHGRETPEEKKADLPSSTATSTASQAPDAPTPGA